MFKYVDEETYDRKHYAKVEDIKEAQVHLYNMLGALGSPMIHIPLDTIITNDLKKGSIILEKSTQTGEWWVAEVIDNMRGNIRMCTIYGWEIEAGSIYSFEIEGVWNVGESCFEKVSHTKSQEKLRERVISVFG